LLDFYHRKAACSRFPKPRERVGRVLAHDGLEEARRLRADPALAGLLLVTLCGYAQPKDLQWAAVAGFDCHIAKSPSLEQIEELLGNLR
jgi:CheY-like chemotaxis protein